MATTAERERIRRRLDAIRHERDFDDEPDAPAGAVANAAWLDPVETPRNEWLPERLRDARLNPGKRGAAAIVAIGLVAAVIAGVSVLRDRPQTQALPPLPAVEVAAHETDGKTSERKPGAAEPNTPDSELVVSVVGLVNTGGLVRLPPGARVADAVAAAGGAREGADLLSLNMAQRVADGDQIVVQAPGAAPPAMSSTAAPAAGGQPSKPGKVGLNTATEQELDALPGVGPVTAAAIVAWRTTNGKFTDIEQLGEVDGIGPSRLAKLRELVVL